VRISSVTGTRSERLRLMLKLSAQEAQRLNKRYAGRTVGIVHKGPHKGTEWGYLLIVSESGMVYHSEDFHREFFISWDDFSHFSKIGEPKAMNAARYNRNNQGKFSKSL
jgi:hypothetical protein